MVAAVPRVQHSEAGLLVKHPAQMTGAEWIDAGQYLIRLADEPDKHDPEAIRHAADIIFCIAGVMTMVRSAVEVR
jgi:hypothetical protein